MSAVKTFWHRLRARLGESRPGLHQEWRILLVLGLCLIGSAWLFFEIVEDMVWGNPLVAADITTFHTLQGLRTPAFDSWMVAVTELGDAVVVTSVALVAVAWLVWRRAWRAAACLALAVGGGSAINTAIKLGLHRVRPSELDFAGASVFSFPSGHSTTNAALYGAVIIVTSRALPLRTQLPVAGVLVLLVAGIAFSRLYLGAHWLSDVGGGLAFACAWLALLGMVYMWHPAEPMDASGFLLVVIGALVVVGGLNIILHHSGDLRLYAVQVRQAVSP